MSFYLTSFLGGVIAFFSPCTLPLLPGYLAYISGLSSEIFLGELNRAQKNKILGHLIFFVFGFSLIFVLLGVTATWVGRYLFQNQLWFQKIGGILVVFFGLQFLGFFKIKFLEAEKRIQWLKRPAGLPGAFLMGVIFAFGWTPCLGPILASLLTWAAAQSTIFKGSLGLGFFSLGLAGPFIISGIFVNFLLKNFQKLTALLKWSKIIAGFFLIATGISMIFNWLPSLAAILADWFNFSGI